MLDSIKIGHFISEKRKELKMTQQQLADKLKVSFQAVSKWETEALTPIWRFFMSWPWRWVLR